MGKRSRWQYVFGAAVLAAVAALVLVVISLLGVTDKADIYLADTADERSGWRYEILVDGQVQDYEPVFGEKSYPLMLPEGVQAVRISRIMTEDITRAELEWMRYGDGVEVSLDGELLHTDFPQLARDENGFVHPDQELWDQLYRESSGAWQRVRMSLPDDYLGRELTVTTYFPPDGGSTVPEYPFLGSEDSTMADAAVFSVRYNVVMTIYAMLALAMAGMVLLEIHNSNANSWTLLLMCLHFVMLFLNTAYGTYAGYYSVLTERLDLRFLRAIYMVPLYLYLAQQIKSRWKWPLCVGILLWAGYAGAREFLVIRANANEAYTIGPGALVVFLTVAAALFAEELRQRGRRTRQEKKRLSGYSVIAAAVTAVYLLGRARVWDGLQPYLVDGIWTALRMGNCGPLVTLVTDVTSYMTVVVVVTEVIRRTVQTRRTVDVLRERSRQTMESYERMLASEDATNALRHEMRHHMTALAAILDGGEAERAQRYVDAVLGDMDRLPTGRYSQNLLVNVIAGSYLDRARAQWIRVEHRLNVPQALNIADEDLSVFLSNMLQNALEACERMDPGADRYIKVDMQLKGNFLFIRCVNSAPEGPEKREERSRRGYGIDAMQAVAEKYNSVLVINRSKGEFSAMSNLCMTR